METLIIVALVVAIAGMLATFQIMLYLRRMVNAAVSGIGSVLVDQLIVDKLLLLLIIVWGLASLSRDEGVPLWIVVVLALGVAAGPFVLIYRWHRWRREDRK